jgi:hypothetical protein
LAATDPLSIDCAQPRAGDLQHDPYPATGWEPDCSEPPASPLARPYASLERFGFLILLAIMFLIPMMGRQIGVDLNLFRWLVAIPLAYVIPVFLWMTGLGWHPVDLSVINTPRNHSALDSPYRVRAGEELWPGDVRRTSATLASASEGRLTWPGAICRLHAASNESATRPTQ